MSDAPLSSCVAEVIDLDAEVTPADFDPSISEDERRFYTKAYPSLQLVCDRKVHCTICKMHIGTAPAQESLIKMHPVLRVTHCTKCHDFYNSGEFSKGEDGSELYCRWCGQGGEVYCCSNCPYVFCKSCIVKNLSRGVVADIEQNENWSCFNCAPKILWPLRAQHWALVKYIDKQKKKLSSMGLSEAELKHEMMKDRSACCRLAKSKSNNLSDSAESVDSISRRSLSAASSSSTGKKAHKIVSRSESPAAKRSKQSNDEVVCTPDLLSMLEPDCQITVSPKPPPSHAPMASSPKVMSIHSPGVYSGNNPMQTSTPKNTPPPLVLRNTSVQMRQNAASSPVVRRTVVGSRSSGSGSAAPVYHTINGYRIDLNTAAQQETFRLPNGKLIQVKRQGSSNNTSPSPVQPVPTPPQPHNSWQRNVHVQHPTRPVHITPAPGLQPYSQINVQPPQHPQMLQYQNAAMSNTTVTSLQNGSPAPIHFINGGLGATAQQLPPQPSPQLGAVRPLMVRVAYPDTAFGHSRTQLQDQVFNTMEICLHLTSKVQTLTNSNAYKQARNYMDVKELYIHLSYLLTYAIGRFKGLQDKCLVDMRQLGFSNDADSLENGQLAAGVDYVRYGQLDDVELFSAGCNSFHNQVYEYRKSLLENLENDGESREEFPLSPLLQIGSCFTDNDTDNEEDTETEKPNDDDDKTNPNDLKRPPTVEETDSRESAKERRATEHQHSSQMEKRKQQERSQSSSLLRPAEENADCSQEFEGDDDYDMSRPGGGADEGECDGGGGEVSRRETESRAIDHKLIRLIELYPSIWCSRYPDYGNYEVTRVYWNRIAAQFKPDENIKLRWKNIRKRFVRIEERLKSGKRFNGYYNKATNFLFNRNLAEHDWQKVDKGEAENAKRFPAEAGGDDWLKGIVDNTVPDVNLDNGENDGMDFRTSSIRPLEISSTDLKIINFVKCNPVLWRKTHDHAFQRVDEQTRKNLWTHLWKQIPASDCDELIDRWSYLYELYKTFRLKHIKDENTLANLEVKYSKYLATLHFLYKIDEDALKRENLIMMDCGNLDMLPDRDMKLQDMPDDREFVLALTRAVFKRTLLWNEKLKDYDDYLRREDMWAEIKLELKDFKRDVKTIKLRWHLARFSYLRLCRERHKYSKEQLPKYCANLPIDELQFLKNN